ncbi:MAG: CPBP family glutamic-type intramembrane protease [Gammaproteobacteria bacterium]
MIGLFILGFFYRLLGSKPDWRRILRPSILWLLITATIILGIAYATHYVRFDPKVPDLFPLWAWSNLFVTVVSEEALFPGLVQQRLAQAFAKIKLGSVIAVIIAAILFGLAHYKAA